ncbi:velvet factor-domain-containing protein [Dactylonectria estremocensis]|uniref:Velvet factor-domain-containing protein n=1 Tax=Dactylonectria estremocensis TaxID=1079267 RepID=A0A9P9IAM1_9HYPO|nr:velvet factor-domain-containing protein [Dactylonectria estremocensis]
MQCLVDLRSPLETLLHTLGTPDRGSANPQSKAPTLQAPASQTDSKTHPKPAVTATSISSHSAQSVTVERITKSGRQMIYELTVDQQPARARACGEGAKSMADRRPIDPPPTVRLRIFEGSSIESGKDITFSYNGNFFMYASLEHARPIAHNSAQTAVPILTGAPVSGMAYLERPIEAGYFLFPALSVRNEGNYRLAFDLFEETKEEEDFDPQPEKPESQVNSATADEPAASYDWRMKVKSDTFAVFSAKKFPGLTQSTSLTKILADQGCRLPIRRDVRMRRRGPKNPPSPQKTPEPTETCPHLRS